MLHVCKKGSYVFFRALSALALRFFSLSKKCAKNTCREDTSKQQRLAQRTGKQVVPFLLSFLAGKLLKASSSHFPLFILGGRQKRCRGLPNPKCNHFFEEKKQYFPVSQVSGESLRNGHMSTRDKKTYLATTTSRQLSLSVKQTKKSPAH